jgi:hypothetical protein
MSSEYPHVLRHHLAAPVGFEISGDPVRAVLFIDKLYFSMPLGNYDPCEHHSLLFNCRVFAGVVSGKPPAADAECLKQCAGALSI